MNLAEETATHAATLTPEALPLGQLPHGGEPIADAQRAGFDQLPDVGDDALVAMFCRGGGGSGRAAHGGCSIRGDCNSFRHL